MMKGTSYWNILVQVYNDTVERVPNSTPQPVVAYGKRERPSPRLSYPKRPRFGFDLGYAMRGYRPLVKNLVEANMQIQGPLNKLLVGTDCHTKSPDGATKDLKILERRKWPVSLPASVPGRARKAPYGQT